MTRELAFGNLFLCAGFLLLDRQAAEMSQREVMKGMALSVFCLAATGAGWGVRLQQSILMGCIPIVIAPDVEVKPCSCTRSASNADMCTYWYWWGW